MRSSRRLFLRSCVAGLAATAIIAHRAPAQALPLTDEERKRRIGRSPELVATQLAAVYGQQVKSLSYIPSLAVIGRLRLAEAKGDVRSKQQCLELADGLAERVANREVKPGPEGAGLLLLAKTAPQVSGAANERTLAILKRFADQAFDDAGNPLPAMPGHSEMSDSIFMVCPLLAAAGQLLGESRYFDACERHFEFLRSLCERDDGLYRHSPLCEAAWGRGNGFPALGLAMSLDYLPEQHSAHAKFRTAADKLLIAVLKHTDPMVHQVVDHPESYQEFTGTAMCAFAALRLSKLGTADQGTAGQDETRAKWVQEVWTELKSRISEQGELINVCESTGKQKSLEDYFKRKAIVGRDDRGGAMALLMATEMMQTQ